MSEICTTVANSRQLDQGTKISTNLVISDVTISKIDTEQPEHNFEPTPAEYRSICVAG